MDPGRVTQNHALLRALGPAVLVLLALSVAGCQGPEPRYDWHGREPVLGVYTAGSLYTELPPDIPVQSVIAAARMALERRGYVITASESTDDTGRVVARPGDPKLLRKVTVTAHLRSNATSVTVRTNPGGDEHFERDILERILTRLGL